MKAGDDSNTDDRVVQRGLWESVQRRYEKIRYGRAGRFIGYIVAFTLIALLLFAVIMVVGYNSR
jgi:large-conductance mechanosensitive channel